MSPDIAELARLYFVALDAAERRRIRPGMYRGDDPEVVSRAESALRDAAGAPPIPGVDPEPSPKETR